MKTFKDAFQKEIDVEVDFGPVMRFSMMRNWPEIKSFVFVEGSTDKIFYENTSIPVLSDHAYYFFRTLSDGIDKDVYKGKEAVFYSLKKIVENEKLNEVIDRCRFIVDRDYEKVKRSKHVRLKPKDYARVYVTKGHSMESYFVEKDNLETVFHFIELDMGEFLRIFDIFAMETGRFHAYRAVITNNYGTGVNIRYRKKYSNEEIFKFDFSKNEYWVGKPKMQEECQRMKKALSPYPYLQRKVDSLQKEIVSDRINVRGHDAFLFLEQYIKQKANKSVFFPNGDRLVLREMIGRFKVELSS